MEKDKLVHGNELFIQTTEEKFLKQLVHGQSPDIFVLSCCDSRVSPTLVTQSSLGEIFVHRNVANQVVEEDDSFTASLYYALHYLKVKMVVIMGHTNCGGIHAAWENNQDEELKSWVTQIRKNLPDRSIQPCITLDEVSKKNVIKQVANLKKHPVYQKYGEGVEVKGCLFHMETGKVEKIID